MTYFNRRENGQKDGPARQHISRLAFVLAGLLIAVTAISLTFVGYVASNASNQQAIDNEKRLFHNSLENAKHLIVHEQLNMSRGDQSVRRIVRAFDYEYVRDQIRALWTDYRQNKVLIIANGDRVLAESFEDYTHIMNRPLSDTPAYFPVVKKAKELYLANRVRIPGGFSHRTIQGLEPTDFAAVGFARIDDKPALVAALPVIPDQEKVTLPDGPPTILVSVKFIDAPFLSSVNAQLSFTGLTFGPAQAENPESPSYLVHDTEGQPLGSFFWKSHAQGTSIWPTVIPVILILSLLLAVLAIGIAWRIGGLTSSLQASERQNRHLALHDSLSGLANRLQFNRALSSAVENLPAKPFALIHCDLDKFKAVNDTHGHAAGDTVIKVVAERMKDVVGSGGMVARLGGDEFVILFRSFTDRGRLTLLCGRLINAVEVPIELDNGLTAEVGLSIGIVTAPECGKRAETLMAAADDALYYSKGNGRGQAAFASDLDPFLPMTASPEQRAKSERSSDAA